MLLLFETCIMTLVSFSGCELHRGITTYSQLVATGYSQERKNPRAARGKKAVKTLLHLQFYSKMFTNGYRTGKLPLYKQKSRYVHTCHGILCFGLSPVSKRQPLQLAL